MSEENNNKDDERGLDNEGENNEGVTLESLTNDILERDNIISEKDKRIDELEKAYKILYERGKFNTPKVDEPTKDTKVSYEDILSKLD